MPLGALCAAKPATAAVLMGCSSARLLAGHPARAASGALASYVHAHAPCVVANLWDVTDRDIDRFTITLLSRWLPGAPALPAASSVPSVVRRAVTGSQRAGAVAACSDANSSEASAQSASTVAHAGSAAVAAEARAPVRRGRLEAMTAAADAATSSACDKSSECGNSGPVLVRRGRARTAQAEPGGCCLALRRADLRSRTDQLPACRGIVQLVHDCERRRHVQTSSPTLPPRGCPSSRRVTCALEHRLMRGGGRGRRCRGGSPHRGARCERQQSCMPSALPDRRCARVLRRASRVSCCERGVIARYTVFHRSQTARAACEARLAGTARGRVAETRRRNHLGPARAMQAGRAERSLTRRKAERRETDT